LPDSADVVVVGAGIMGLAVAYHLAKDHRRRRILVVDAGYLCGGASGRNGGGVRAQWSSEANVRLMQESLHMCKEFAHEHRINTWFRQGGYLFLARDEKRASELSKSVELQHRLGLGTRLINAAEAQRLVPQLEPRGVLAASFNADDAVVFPWPFVWGYAEGARALGVDVQTFCRVHAIEISAIRRGHRARQRACAAGRERVRRVESGARRNGRRRAANQAPPSRDLRERAAQTISGTARGGARLGPVRRAARSSAASATRRFRRDRARHRRCDFSRSTRAG
jgi:sarcosine oxidase, subunit beta